MKDLTASVWKKFSRWMVSALAVVWSVTGTAAGAQTVVTPTAFVAPSAVDFGSLAAGTSGNPWTLTLNNTSGATMTIAGMVLSDVNDFSYSTTCGGVLNAYSTCNILVGFTPKSAGIFSATLTVNDDAQGAPHVVTLNGQGTGTGPTAPVAVVSPGNISFGAQAVGTVSNPWTVTLSNTSGSSLTIGGLLLSSGAFTVSQNCGSVLAAYSTCKLLVAFAPTSAGQVNGTLTIHDNSQSGAEVVTLDGIGAGPGTTVQLSPDVVAFSSQAVGTKSNPWTVNFSNLSGNAVSVTSVRVTEIYDFSETNDCGASVRAYSSCQIEVYFNPQQGGNLHAKLIVDSSGSPSTLMTSLTGTAIGGTPRYAINVNPAAMSLKAGETGTATFTLTPMDGYMGTVALACSGLPNGSTCNFAPAALTADGSNTELTSVLTVTTSGVYAQLERGPVGFSVASLLACVVLVKRRKKVRSALTLAMGAVMLLGGLMAVSGCGAGALAGSTAAGTSSVTVTAFGTATGGAGSQTQTASFVLTVSR